MILSKEADSDNVKFTSIVVLLFWGVFVETENNLKRAAEQAHKD